MNNQGLTAERQAELAALSARLGVVFSDLSLLDTALTHTSYANEGKRINVASNERLEYLGDAVLELATSDYLYRHHPELSEGELTKTRASIVCEASLCPHSLALGLGEHLLLGRGEKLTGGDKRPSILADVFEAVIGAIYIDQGWLAARDYVAAQLKAELAAAGVSQKLADYKSELQEIIQRNGVHNIVYELLDTEGPDHAKIFTVCVRINGDEHGIGRGKSKKEAEQAAAKAALMIIH